MGTEDVDTFKAIKRRVLRELLQALERAALTVYYPECNVELQIRSGKLTRVEVREVQTIA